MAPDQQHIAFFEHPQGGDDRGNVCVVDLHGQQRVLSTGWSSLRGISWSVYGKEVWFSGSNTGGNQSIYAVTLSGHVRPVLRVPGSLLLYDIAPDGRVLLAQSDTRRVVMGLTPGSSQERDLSWLDWSNARDLTPDGRLLLFDEQAEGGGPNYSIYVRRTDGSPAVRVGDNDAFSISADGKWVLATTNAGGGSLVLLPTGAGEPRPLKTANLQDPIARFLPDGKRILIFSADLRVYVQMLESESRRPLTPPGVFRLVGSNANNPGVFTADGKYLLGGDAQQNWALYPIEGGQPIPLPKWTAGDLPINHTTDSHSFFVGNGNLPVDVYRFDFSTGARQFVRQLRPADPTGMERLSNVLMTPDGKYYVYGGPRELSNLYVVTGLK
jgi:eukaryotic-like serine/threonine-protein kinase